MLPRDYNPMTEDRAIGNSHAYDAKGLLGRLYDAGKSILKGAWEHKKELGTTAALVIAANVDGAPNQNTATAQKPKQAIIQDAGEKYLKSLSKARQAEITKLNDHSVEVLIGPDGEKVTCSIENAVKSIKGTLPEEAYIGDTKIYLQSDKRYTWDEEGHKDVKLTSEFVEEEGGLVVSIGKESNEVQDMINNVMDQTKQAYSQRMLRTKAKYDSLKTDVREAIIKDEEKKGEKIEGYFPPEKDDMTVLDDFNVHKILSKNIVTDSAGMEALKKLNHAGTATFIDGDEARIAVYRYSIDNGKYSKRAMISLSEKDAEEVRKIIEYGEDYRRFTQEKDDELSTILEEANKNSELPATEADEKKKVFGKAIKDLNTLKDTYKSSDFSAEKEVVETVSSIEKNIENYKEFQSKADFDEIEHYFKNAQEALKEGKLGKAKGQNNLAMWAAYSFLMENQGKDIDREIIEATKVDTTRNQREGWSEEGVKVYEKNLDKEELSEIFIDPEGNFVKLSSGIDSSKYHITFEKALKVVIGDGALPDTAYYIGDEDILTEVFKGKDEKYFFDREGKEPVDLNNMLPNDDGEITVAPRPFDRGENKRTQKVAVPKQYNIRDLITMVTRQNHSIDKKITEKARNRVEELRKDKKFEAAKYLNEKIQELNPENRADKRANKKIRSEFARQVYKEGKALEKAGDTEAAFEKYQKAAELRPDIDTYSSKFGKLAKEKAEAVNKSIEEKKRSDVGHLIEKYEQMAEHSSTSEIRDSLGRDISNLLIAEAGQLINKEKYEKAGHKITEAKKYNADETQLKKTGEEINSSLEDSKKNDKLKKIAKKEKEKLEKNKQLFLEGKVEKAAKRFRQQQARFEEIKADYPTFFAETDLAPVEKENLSHYNQFINPVSSEFAENKNPIAKAMSGLAKGTGILLAGEFYDQETGRFSLANFKKHPVRTTATALTKAAIIAGAVYYNFFYESPEERDRRLYEEHNDSSPSTPSDNQTDLDGSGDGETDTGSPDTPIESEQDENY